MKIIQINASYKPAYIYGGPTMSVAKLCECLEKDNSSIKTEGIPGKIEVEVLTTTANGRLELPVKPGMCTLVNGVAVTYYKRLSKDHTHFSPALLNALQKRLREKRKSKQIVHIHAWWNLVSVMSCMVALHNNIKVIISPRGTLSSYSFGNRNSLAKSFFHRFIGRPLLDRCHIHATSFKEKADLLKIIKPKSITVIPNLVELPPAKLKMLIGADEFKLLFFSRIEQKKGIELLFQALATLEFAYSLTIAGTGEPYYLEQLKTLANTLNISSKIIWIGQQPAEKKFDIMAAHNLLILSSHNENFANVVIESLASGTAVVVTENVGLSDYVIENDLGWVCRFEAKDLVKSINQAFSDLNKRERIRRNAPSKIREDFSDSKLIERYVDLYETVLMDAK